MGPLDSAGGLQQHPDNGVATGSVDFATGASQGSASANSPDHQLQVRRHAIESAGPDSPRDLKRSRERYMIF